MRRITACLLTLMLLLGFAVSAHAEADTRVMMNGAIAHYNTAITDNGRVLLPAAAIADLFGFKLSENETDKSITLSREGTSIVMWMDMGKAYINGKDVKVDTPPRKVNGDTYVPLRFIAEATDTVVSWDQNEQMIVLTPVRSFLAELMAHKQAGDQKLTGGFSMNYSLFGGPGMKITMDGKLSLTTQTYKGDALTKMVIDIAGDSTTIEEALVGGKTYTRTSTDVSGTWRPGIPTTGNSTEAMSALFGGIDLEKAGQQLIGSSKVSLAGTAEKDGAKVVKVKIEIATSEMERMFQEFFGALAVPVPADEPGISMKVDHYTFTYWVNPDTMYIHRMELDLDATMASEDPKDPMTIRMTVNGGFDLAPSTEPIQFPADLPK